LPRGRIWEREVSEKMKKRTIAPRKTVGAYPGWRRKSRKKRGRRKHQCHGDGPQTLNIKYLAVVGAKGVGRQVTMEPDFWGKKPFPVKKGGGAGKKSEKKR